jgi:predicted MFS family arabinose efflux permease
LIFIKTTLLRGSILASESPKICVRAWVTITGLVIGVLLMDLGVQSVQVAAQTKVISLLPEARSRLNTLYMVARFSGGALGSILGAVIWSSAKWPGVCGICVIVITLALLVHLVGNRKKEPASRENCF